jgi:RNA recognition motif-containing protein
MLRLIPNSIYAKALIMADPFEYDVFLSFSTADEEIARPIWQELSLNGLRVFWSDATLKEEVGNSWFDVIEKSLKKSQHMILVCSTNAMSSTWVQREYKAFLDRLYKPNFRRLIPVLTRGFMPNDLPLFLQELQVGSVDDPRFIQEIIPLLGGVNIEIIRKENKALKDEVDILRQETRKIAEQEFEVRSKLKQELQARSKLEHDYRSIQEQVHQLRDENTILRTNLDETKEKGTYAIETEPLETRVVSVQAFPDSTTPRQVFDAFSSAGKVLRVFRSFNLASFWSALVEMSTSAEAQNAIKMFNNQGCLGRYVMVVPVTELGEESWISKDKLEMMSSKLVPGQHGLVIVEPADFQSVGQSFKVNGTCENLLNDQNIWVSTFEVYHAVEDNQRVEKRRYWPQEQASVVPMQDGQIKWHSKVNDIGGGSTTETKVFAVLVVGPKGQSLFQHFKDVGVQTGDWTPIDTLPDDTMEIGTGRVSFVPSASRKRVDGNAKV